MINKNWQKNITLKSGKEVLFRYPFQEDAQDFLEYFNPIVEENVFILVNALQTLEDEKQYLSSIIKDHEENKGIHIVAIADGEIIAKTEIRSFPYKKVHIGSVGITVSKEYRGQGLGKMILKEVIDQAKTNLGLQMLVLECFAENTTALELYSHLGFQEYGRLPRALKQSGSFLDEVLMYKLL